MTPDDMSLVREFVTRQSEPAFATLVERYVALVHSAAFRQTGDAQLAEEITQAVFIILARKAATLGKNTILPAWLYRTARYVASNAQTIQRRRRQREQEAYMQGTLQSDDTATAWQQLAPLLDDAMAGLAERDRALLVLRYFENRPWREVAELTHVTEDAAQKRVTRALEKLRDLFAKRGVTLTAVLIAGAVSAHSVKAAPATLAKTATALAFAKSVTASSSTLTLAKGALKLMAWTKAKTAAVAGIAALLVAGTTTLIIEKTLPSPGQVLTRRLSDGSVLQLNHIAYGMSAKFVHDKRTFDFSAWNGKMLAVEFKLSPATPDNTLLAPTFFRQYRCAVRGEQGIEFIEEFSPSTRTSGRYAGGFEKFSDGAFAYISTTIFPRDSHWLWFRIESSETNNPYGPWQTVAEFKVRNPTQPANETWAADSLPITHSAAGLDLVLSNVTVQLQPMTPRDIWNHTVKFPTAVFQDGTPLTNWGVARATLQDASGNFNPVLQTHRSLDPRFVWKLDMDFEPQSGFGETNLISFDVPAGRKFSTQVEAMGVPITVSQNANWIDASMPTNRPDLALKLVNVTDQEGRKGENGAGSWGQYNLRFGDFMVRLPDGTVTFDFKPAHVTLAVVPNIHTTFYAQPTLIP